MNTSLILSLELLEFSNRPPPDQIATLFLMSPEILQGIATGFLALLGGTLVIILARRQMLSFRYAAGWLVLLTLTALSGILIPLTRPLAKALSTTPGVLVSGMAILILVLICIQLSVSISGLQKQIQKLAEELALREIEGTENNGTQENR